MPNELERLYQGFGGNTEKSGKSALRVQIRLNLQTGQMQGPWLQEARQCEQKSPASVEELPLPKNALYVADAAYFPFQVMKQLDSQHVWWLTHAKADLTLVARVIKYTMTEFIKAHAQSPVIDQWITLGATSPTRQKVRLIAFRVSDQTAKRRREQVNRNTKTRGKGSRRDVQVGKKHQRPSQDGRHRPGLRRIELSEWTILLTNAPADLLAPYEARALMRCRW